MIEVLYFAWVRERIGLPRERLETSATTVADLVEELRAREERYAMAFAELSSLRVALDQELASFDAPLAGVRCTDQAHEAPLREILRGRLRALLAPGTAASTG